MASAIYFILSILSMPICPVLLGMDAQLRQPAIAIQETFGQPKDSLLDLRLATVRGKEIRLDEFRKNKATVLVFLSVDCPLSQNYTLTLNKLYEHYKSQQIAFYAVFPSDTEKKKAVKAFLNTYHVQFEALLDPQLRLTKTIQAKVTPEAYIINQRGEILYSGMIDNWAYALGKKRAVITESYLEDGVKAVLSNSAVKVKRTEAVGCYINGLN